jgi:hypothetical protein
VEIVMPVDNKFERVAPNDPKRCQANTAHAQCPYKATEHTKYCPMHGGNIGEEKRRKQMLAAYNVTKWNNRIEEFAAHDQVKSLRAEIGIVRMTMEAILSQCQSQVEVALYSSKILDTASKIERIVMSCNRLETNLGMLLDKTSALNLAVQIVNIVSEVIDDAEKTNIISNKIAIAIANIGGEGDSQGIS